MEVPKLRYSPCPDWFPAWRLGTHSGGGCRLLFLDQRRQPIRNTFTSLQAGNDATQAFGLFLVPFPIVVKIVESDFYQLDASILLGFQAAVEDNLDSRPSHHDPEEDHNHDEEITSANLILDRAFDPEKLQQQEIYRMKGFVAVPNKSMRLVMQGTKILPLTKI